MKVNVYAPDGQRIGQEQQVATLVLAGPSSAGATSFDNAAGGKRMVVSIRNVAYITVAPDEDS